jgi:hypothetical protein
MKVRQRDTQFFCLFAIRTPNQEITDFYPTSHAQVMLIYLNPPELAGQQIFAEVERILDV